MGGAWERWMHPVSFRLKRAHLCAVAFGRKAVERVGGMTPARFDVLYAIRQSALCVGPLFPPLMWGRTQKELTRLLGLSRATVSKMLKRLEEMGWIRRQPAADDRRVKYVTLTKEGLRRTWRAMRRVFRGRILLKKYEDLFRPGPWCTSSRHVLDLVADAWNVIDSIALDFGDKSGLDYDLGIPLLE
jgi:DNA-binding MarR family transcriptional regulator